jgi:signal peptidase II
VRLFALAAIGAFVAGYAVSLFAETIFSEPIAVIGEWFILRYAENPGIAFGIRIPSPWQEILILAALAVVTAVAFRNRTSIGSLAYGLIVGGALANVADRFGDGMVSDYVAVGSFPVFNVPDSCISVGVALLLAESVGIFQIGKVKS